MTGGVTFRATQPRALLAAVLALGCHSNGHAGRAETGPNPSSAPLVQRGPSTPGEARIASCLERIARLEREPSLPGTPAFETHRAEILGRARGESFVFVRAPEPVEDDALSERERASRRALRDKSADARVRGMLLRHRGDRKALRALLLRERYLWSDDPAEALALVSRLDLTKLFDEPEIVLERGVARQRLERVEPKTPFRSVEYRYTSGELSGRRAELLLGDRIAVTDVELGTPLARDFGALSREVGFDRAQIERISERGIVAELRFGNVTARALVESEGAALRLGCIAAPASVERAISAWQRADAPRRQALTRLQSAVGELVEEALPFDRPRGEDTPDRDGELRPEWRFAYKTGQSTFKVDDVTYPVFDGRGRPYPPEVCVDFVLDSYERAAGSWFRPRGERRERPAGALDFDEQGLANRRGVLAFEKFAQSRPDLFDVVRFVPEQRIPFRDRTPFFRFLEDHADDFRPGDVVAIQGLKRDGRVHQHAILIEAVDPVSGFPSGLADQMHGPRRRTWETIMAEAPLRSLLYRVRPQPSVFFALERTG